MARYDGDANNGVDGEVRLAFSDAKATLVAEDDGVGNCSDDDDDDDGCGCLLGLLD